MPENIDILWEKVFVWQLKTINFLLVLKQKYVYIKRADQKSSKVFLDRRLVLKAVLRIAYSKSKSKYDS
jgi:hypothetical protein